MSLAVTTVGTGTAFPEASRGPTCSLIEHGDQRTVVDLGSGSLQKLAGLGVTPLDIDALLITHAHLDHLADVLPLLFALGVPGYDRSCTLPIYVSTPTLKTLRSLDDAFGGWLSAAERQVQFIELSPGEVNRVGALDLHVEAMNHHESSIGYRFGYEGVAFAIPGDTGPCDEVVRLCRDADFAILECSMRDDQALPSHLTPSQIVQIINDSRVNQVALVHRYPSVFPIDVVEELTRRTSARVSIPDDGARFVLG